MEKMTLKAAFVTILRAVGNGLIEVVAVILKNILRFDKNVLKRYLNIETPVYRAYWRHRRYEIQRQLDKLHGTDYAKRLKNA